MCVSLPGVCVDAAGGGEWAYNLSRLEDGSEGAEVMVVFSDGVATEVAILVAMDVILGSMVFRMGTWCGATQWSNYNLFFLIGKR